MHFRGLDLNLLVALDALLTERSATLAASRMHLSQSGMSSALARLRLYFHDELLLVQGRQMIPTPLGASLARPVRELLESIQREVLSQNSFDPAAARRTLRFMASDYVSIVFLPEVISRIRAQAPGVGCEIIALNDKPGSALEGGQTDFLILPQQYLSVDHPTLNLFEDTYVCIVDASNSRFGDSITQEEFLRSDKVIQRFGLTGVPAADVTEIERLGSTTSEIVVPSFSLLPHFVVGTERVSLIPKRFALAFAELLPIRILPSPIPVKVCEMLQWHSRHAQDPLIRWVTQLIEPTALNGAELPGLSSGS